MEPVKLENIDPEVIERAKEARKKLDTEEGRQKLESIIKHAEQENERMKRNQSMSRICPLCGRENIDELTCKKKKNAR
jgi:DNA mismatch repair ATPase MutS